MARGGARNRSGPQPDPESLTSARRGLTFDSLDPAGYGGPVPEFPLRSPRVMRLVTEGNRRWHELDEDGTAAVVDREGELWEWAWRTPQALAWIGEPWRWHTVAMWVRTAVVCEGAGALAADKNSLHRFADQIGLTPAGLRENGWVIAEPVVEEDDSPAEGDVRARLSVVPSGAA